MTKRLPEFVVETIVDADALGRFERSKWVGEGWGVALRVGDQFVRGEFTQVDASSSSARVRINNAADIAALRVGESYPFIDLYWGDRAILVLDRSREWVRTTFQPVDAVERYTEECRVLSKASPERAGGRVVAGGWDHEHCEICWEKIGRLGQPIGWANARSEWLCEACYEAYLVPRSLEFVNVE